MGLSLDTCVICGMIIGGRDESWTSEARAIYSTPLNVNVTGVGYVVDEATFIAPSDPAKKWSDPDYQFPEEDSIPVMRQCSEDGRHGYVLHEACWLLLEESFGPSKIPIARLLDICESLPFPIWSSGSVSWDHDFGGLWTHNVLSHYSWEEWFETPEEWTEIVESAYEDPFNVPERSTHLTLPVNNEQPVEWKPRKPAQDCFSLLPWEILEKIIMELSTTDALTLRLASTSFQPLLWSSSFWASRFNVGGEREFMFEKRGIGDAGHWLSVFKATHPRSWSNGLRNRRRVWDLIRSISHIAGMRLAGNSVSPPSDTRAWVLVGGKAVDRLPGEPWWRIREGCYVRGSHVISVPEDLSKVGFSTYRYGNLSYLTGLRFISSAGSDTCAGFISPEQEVTYEVKAIRGFRTAVGAGGIRAVQVIHKDGRLSPWVGVPHGIPISERLSDFGVLGYVRVGFDGYKVVQLGVCEREPVSTHSAPVASLPLRRTALWYPDVPSTGLFLNDSSFTGENPVSSLYRPFFWTHFGGQGGSRLCHITGLSVNNLHRLNSIKFFYDDVEAAESAQVLGCDSASNSETTFALDGAGGEYLDSIEVGIRREDILNPEYAFMNHGYLVSVKMTTNRGRTCAVGKVPDQDSIHQMNIAHGTTITGLYATQHKEYGIISLGIISEMVQPQNISAEE